ncbi:hypothetical protein BgiMline_008726, partial [Biomphalaria glabrata]
LIYQESIKLAINLQVFCTTCQEVKGDTCTSPKSENVHSVYRQVVAATLATGMGQSGLAKFSEIMDMPVVTDSFVNKLIVFYKSIFIQCI